jgi:hypothetical protein
LKRSISQWILEFLLTFNQLFDPTGKVGMKYAGWGSNRVSDPKASAAEVDLSLWVRSQVKSASEV